MYICHIFFDLLVSFDETCYLYWIFRNSILRLWWEKLFASHSVLVDMMDPTKKEIFRICEDFLYFSFWFDCIAMWFLNFFFNNSNMISVTVLLFLLAWFLLGIVNSWYIPRSSIFCDKLWRYCVAIEVTPLAQYRQAINLLRSEQL